MANKDDVEFTYDTKGFTAAMNQMVTKFDSAVTAMSSHSKNLGSVTEKNITKGFLKAQVLFAGLSKAFNFAVGQISKNIPEIGQTFNLVSGIAMRNLLNPLRRELVPLLQKVLDWTMNHRKAFVEWGGFIANAFKTIVTIGKVAWELIKNFTEGLFKSFGMSKDGFMQTLNLLLFKVTAVVIAAGIMLAPIFKTVGEVVGDIIKLVAKVIDLLSKSGVLNAMLEIVQNLFTILDGIVKLLSGDFKGGMEKLVSGITGANPEKKAIGEKRLAYSQANIWGKLSAKDQKAYQGELDIASFIGGVAGSGYLDVMKKYGKKAGINEIGVQDAIITKTGQVIRTSPDDNIFATKGMPGKSKIDIGPMTFNINVTEGNARAAGENFGRGLGSQFRTMMLDNMVAQGMR
jgi:hypothetical protein